jgi:hypothetical protein
MQRLNICGLKLMLGFLIQYIPSKTLHYNFSFANFLLEKLQNLMKVMRLSLTKIIKSFTSFIEFFNQVFLTNLSNFNITSNYKLDSLAFNKTDD